MTPSHRDGIYIEHYEALVCTVLEIYIHFRPTGYSQSMIVYNNTTRSEERVPYAEKAILKVLKPDLF